MHGRYSRIGFLEGIGSLRGQHNAQNALAAVAACLQGRARPRRDPVGAGKLSRASRTAWSRSAARTMCCSSTIPRRPTRMRRRRRCRPSSASTGSPAACPRKAASSRCAAYFPRIAKAYLIGEAAPAFSATLGEAVPYEISGTLDAAVEHAAARRGARREPAKSVVLLSPACASFDQFKNFEVRGEAFRAAVACYRRGASRSEGRTDAEPSRQKPGRQLVVDGRPLVPGGLPVADGARHRAVLRGKPGGRRAHRPRQLPFRHAPDHLHVPGAGRDARASPSSTRARSGAWRIIMLVRHRWC